MNYLHVLKDVRDKRLPRIVANSSYKKYSQFCFLVDYGLIDAVRHTPQKTGMTEYLDSSLTEIGRQSLDLKKLPQKLLELIPEGAGGTNWTLSNRLLSFNIIVAVVAVLVTVVATFYFK
ncbi:hypothetical protein ACOYR1_01765 [Thalassotalea piscium]